MSKAPIDLYYWPTPNGHKVTILLEEAGIAYTLKPVNIMRGEQFDPAFLKISPNNRIPAIVDPDGPGGQPISVFESGAILQYLGRKCGRFYPTDERRRVDVEQWLFWQMGGLGPMFGQANHFRHYAPEQVRYGIDRYTNEANRLYGVMERGLEARDYLAVDYSIADMAAFPWARTYERVGQDIGSFPRVKGWLDRIAARPAVVKALAVADTVRDATDLSADKEAQKVLFGQRAR